MYLISHGVEHQLSPSLIRGGGMALPFIALVFLATAMWSSSSRQSSGETPYIPAKNPISAISAGSTNSKPSSSKTKNGNLALDNTAGSSASPDATNLQAPSAYAPAASISLPSTNTVSNSTGGRGGGDTGASGSTAGSGTGSSPPPTVVCTDLLNSTQVCTACTPPLTLQPGQKALLSADGSCVAVN